MAPDPNKVSIAQFLHPGSEKDGNSSLTDPIKIGNVEYTSYRAWEGASENHGRKFLVDSCNFVKNDSSAEEGKDTVHFWGEAEWATLCRRISDGKDVFLPQYEHRFFDETLDEAVKKTPASRLNTDPYVFGDSFKYCCCQQVRKNGNPTFMHDLQKGSIILFGSNKQGNFLLDTVFVVEKTICHYNNGSDFLQRRGGKKQSDELGISEAYIARTLATIGSNPTNCLPPGSSFALYQGKTYQPGNGINTPFSFVPVKPGNGCYSRPVLNSLKIKVKDENGVDVDLVNPRKNQGFKITQVDSDQMPIIWKNLLKALKGYDLAYHFDE